MVQRFLRQIRVTIGGGGSEIRAQDLYIRFRIRSELTGTPAEGTVDIYNLNEENETRIRPPGQRVRVEASYEGEDFRLIFDGDVRRVERQRVELDRVTRIHVGGRGAVAEEGGRPRAIFMRTYQGTVPVRTIVADAILVLGLESGPLDAIPEDATETGFKFQGDARILLFGILRPLGFTHYIENGIVKISRYARTADDRPEGVTISEETGMIGTPTRTNDGIRVRTLLDPRLTLDTRIRVKSEFLRNRAAELDDRTWKVIEVTHSGDNRGGPFDTVVEARPLES